MFRQFRAVTHANRYDFSVDRPVPRTTILERRCDLRNEAAADQAERKVVIGAGHHDFVVGAGQ